MFTRCKKYIVVNFLTRNWLSGKLTLNFIFSATKTNTLTSQKEKEKTTPQRKVPIRPYTMRTLSIKNNFQATFAISSADGYGRKLAIILK